MLPEIQGKPTQAVTTFAANPWNWSGTVEYRAGWISMVSGPATGQHFFINKQFWFWLNMISNRLVPLYFLAAIMLNQSAAFGQEAAPPAIFYTVDLTDAVRHYVTVNARIPSQGESTTIMMAVWTPGSYLIRDYPKHVVDMVATDEKGNPLTIRKTTKSRWVVDGTAEVKTVHLSYRVYCRERSVRTNWIDDKYAALNGGPTFVTCPKLINSPVEVQLQMPDGWRRSATSLKPSGDRAHQYRAESFHELVDSPIMAGELEVFRSKSTACRMRWSMSTILGFGTAAVRSGTCQKSSRPSTNFGERSPTTVICSSM